MYPVVILILACIVGDVLSVQRGFCNVCRDGPSNKPLRTLKNPGKTFIMNGDRWTCAYLQETVADVRTRGGAGGEARWCAVAQLTADQHCPCNGPPPVVTGKEFVDINPACNLCKSPTLTPNTFSSVPKMFSDKLVDTGFAGRMNCVGLDDALRRGIASTHRCSQLRHKAGPVCCNPEALEDAERAAKSAPKPAPKPASRPASKKGVGQACSRNSDCKFNKCENRKCARKNNGESCTKAFHCKSRLCSNKKCAPKKSNGSFCTRHGECRSNRCTNRKCTRKTSNAESGELLVENILGSDFTDPVVIDKSSDDTRLIAVAALTLGVVSLVLVLVSLVALARK